MAGAKRSRRARKRARRASDDAIPEPALNVVDAFVSKNEAPHRLLPVITRICGENPSGFTTLWLFPQTRVLGAVGVLAPVVFLPRAFVFTAAFFKAGCFFANFFFGVTLFLARFFLTVFFSGVPFFPADTFGFLSFLLVFFLAIRAVYHRHMHAHETELDALRGNQAGDDGPRTTRIELRCRDPPVLLARLKHSSAASVCLKGNTICEARLSSGSPESSEIIFDACSACRVRALTLQASAQPRRVCLPPSGADSQQDLWRLRR
jgi:hypothetical protein